MEQLRQIRLVIEAAGQLATRTRLTNHATTLKHLKVSARQFANVVTGASRSSISPELAMGLIKDMRTLHPQLIEMAFGFGADGELEKYAARHKNEER